MLGLLKVYVDVCGGQQNKPSLWFTSITTKVPSLTPEQVLQELPSAPFMMTGLKSVPEKSLALLFFDILKVLKIPVDPTIIWYASSLFPHSLFKEQEITIFANEHIISTYLRLELHFIS
jgi:hypothetical protein